MTLAPAFEPIAACWICSGRVLAPVHELIFELSEYGLQDPELAAYTGSRLALCRCASCGFAQPAALPALPDYFDRMYDQRWSAAWIRSEFDSTAKDEIFTDVLTALSARLDERRRRLLDVGAHAGRFMSLAQAAGWFVDGVELNPRTAAYAAERTGLHVRQGNCAGAELADAAYDAVTITDVLEHIPRPLDVLARAYTVLASGGWIAVKVPCGPTQLTKETWRARLRPGYSATVADNLVHVSHFSPRSLALALARAGFADITVEPAAPELPVGGGARGALSRGVRRLIHAVARTIPMGVHTVLALNLQGYARRP